jgi:hypothetical protein
MNGMNDLQKRRVYRQPLACSWTTPGLVILIVLSLMPAWPVRAQSGALRYFEETGHTIEGAFLAFFETHGGLSTFGYPLTVVFDEDGHDVQYFQRARFELHDKGKPSERVVLGALGTALHEAEPPIPAADIPPPDHADRFYFAETGHTLSFAFLRFYQEHGGADLLGYPITEWILEPNGRIVQYLERGKLEWYPENPLGKRVQLGMLGTIYVTQNVDPAHTESTYVGSPPVDAPTPTPQPPERSEVGKLYVTLTLMHPMIGSNVDQTAYVYVFDEAQLDVPGASVEVEVQYPNGERDVLGFPVTDMLGRSQYTFAMYPLLPGQVVRIQATARYGNLWAETSAVCLLWW